MKKVLSYLFEHKSLSREQARQVLVEIGQGKYNEHEVTAFMTAYLMRSITIPELQGFRDALLELCVPVQMSDIPSIDIVGTSERLAKFQKNPSFRNRSMELNGFNSAISFFLLSIILSSMVLIAGRLIFEDRHKLCRFRDCLLPPDKPLRKKYIYPYNAGP